MIERAPTSLIAMLVATAALAGGALGASGPEAANDTQHAGLRGPVSIAAERNDETLLVLCDMSGTLLRVDRESGQIVREVELGLQPFDMLFHPDGSRLYVSCRRGQEVIELAADTLEVERRFALRGDPTGVAVSADGTKLFVGVHSLDAVAVIDLGTGLEIKRLAAGNGPEYLRQARGNAPGGAPGRASGNGRIFATNLLPNAPSVDKPPVNEITVIDGLSARVVDRLMLPNANIGRQIGFAPDGSFAVIAVSRPKNLVPMVQVARGWVVTNGFAFIDLERGGEPVQLLVDLPNQAYADPFAIAVMPDGGKFYLSSAGYDTVMAIDVRNLRATIRDIEAGRIRRAADHLGLSRRYVTARIRVGANPVSMALSADGTRLYVANRLDDTISIIDTVSDAVAETMTLGTPTAPTMLLEGQRLFHNAARVFQNQFTCTSCHPDGGFDGLQYDLEPDGIGENILDNRNLRGVDGTAPFKWVGTNPDIATQCGTRTAKWIVRTGWLRSTEVVALAEYIRSIPPVVNPYLSPDGGLTAAQERGKALFERTVRNDGTPIARRDQCQFCHAGPHFSNFERFDVGTQGLRDTKHEFDSAHLTNVFESAPYLHDGRAATLEEIWTIHNPDDAHGISSDWTKQQLNDLVEYLKALGAAEEARQ